MTLWPTLQGTSLPINFYNFINSYLANRPLFCKQGAEVINFLKINAGVPQGSVLGPIVYLLFTHDLPDAASDALIRTFADDTAASAIVKVAKKANLKLEKYLDDLPNGFKFGAVKRMRLNRFK